MNCPVHCLIFRHKERSYRELPIRIADFGVLHRNEFKNALTRVSQFQQDDAHIFCTEESIQSEIDGALRFIQHVYGIFGFEFSLELSTRPATFLGDEQVWNKAEDSLKEALEGFGKPFQENSGKGAFYGPKIDIYIQDARKNSLQCATIQLDFQLPIRFNLEYQAEKGEVKRPVIIHRAILGSVERMFAILLEHTGGKWPFWLSPRQVMVIPVSIKDLPLVEYTKKVHQTIQEAGFYVDLDLSTDRMEKKIRNSQLSQYNYILVLGSKELNQNTVSVRPRESQQLSSCELAEFLSNLSKAAVAFK